MKAIIERHPWLPYVVPFTLFVGLTGMQPYVPGGVDWVYPAKTVLTGLRIAALARPERRLGRRDRGRHGPAD